MTIGYLDPWALGLNEGSVGVASLRVSITVQGFRFKVWRFVGVWDL